MASRPKHSAHCHICTKSASKYTCPKCYILYCSVSCYKHHQQTCARDPATAGVEANMNKAQISPSKPDEAADPEMLEPQPKLLPLTSLKWPYVPEESAFPDPLKRDDPKDLQLHQYEAIATSSKLREILTKHENLPALLISLDELRGAEREHALQKALGVTPPDIDDWRKPKELSEDVLALRELAEAVEIAIRGSNESALGLSWGDDTAIS